MSHLLENFEGPMLTRGQCFPGARTVFHGIDLHSSFRDADWIDVYIFGITGRRLAKSELAVLERLWVYTSYPDARLWCNRVAALAGSTRSTAALGLGAAIAASEAAIFGRQPEIGAADFLVRAGARRAAGEDLAAIVREELRERPRMMGYGRPVAANFVDERIPLALAMMEREGVPAGPYLQLAFEIEAVLEQVTGKRLPMTYASVVVAVPLDFGFTPHQCYLYMQPSLVGGMLPCYLEALERPAHATFPQRCSRIAYDGAAPRCWQD
ncbi:MAG TPA: hypothetical protein VFF16_00910 [Telluria sp.]|nr:hypothetical protein [Telluria sp.]